MERGSEACGRRRSVLLLCMASMARGGKITDGSHSLAHLVSLQCITYARDRCLQCCHASVVDLGGMHGMIAVERAETRDV